MTPLKEELLTEEQVAAIIGYTRKTLQKNRSNGKNHPPFIKIGKFVWFRKKDLENWLKSRPTYEPYECK